LEFRTPYTLNVVATYNATLDATGNYSIPSLPSGGYDVSLKFGTWLRQTLCGVYIGGLSTADFTLTNGDASGDNAVTLTDLAIVLSNYGTPGPDGDLDHSGLVSLTDLGVVLLSFGMRGDN
jgi:hypothetical protein